MLLTFYTQLTSQRSPVTCVIHSHGMDKTKIKKKLKVMNLRCKYQPKSNTWQCYWQVSFTQCLGQEINHLSLYYTFQNCVYTREKFYNIIIVGPQLSIWSSFLVPCCYEEVSVVLRIPSLRSASRWYSSILQTLNEPLSGLHLIWG